MRPSKKDGAGGCCKEFGHIYSGFLQKFKLIITDLNLSRLEQIATLFEMSVVQLLTFNDTEQEQKMVNELETVNKKLMDRETEVIDLQKK